MGNKPSVELSLVAQFKPSAKYHGFGLFATKPLDVGTLLISDKPLVGGERMNDADFQYPLIFDEPTLTAAFVSLIVRQENRTTTLNNVRNAPDQSLTVIRKINAGEELTKNYSVPKWFVLLALDCTGDNPFDKKEAHRHDLDVLTKVADKLGYCLWVSKK